MILAAEAVNDASQNAAENLEKLNYTKVANVLFDVIFPLLTAQEKSVIMLVLRETIGRHREIAAISNIEFAEFGHTSMSTAIEAKNSMIRSGLLIQSKKGGGLKRSRYGLAPEQFIETHGINKKIIQFPEALTENNPSGAPDRQHSAATDTTTSNQQPSLPTLDLDAGQDQSIPRQSETPLVVDDHKEIISEPETFDTGDHIGGGGTDSGVNSQLNSSGCSPADLDSLETAYQGDPEQEEAANPMESSCPIYGEPYKDPEETVSKEIKTNIDGDDFVVLPNGEKKKAFGVVCSVFRSLGVNLGRKDFAFIGYCLKTYGADMVMAKLEIAKRQKKRGAMFVNLQGWLRNALRYDWQGSVYDLTMEKLKIKAQKVDERCVRQSEEHDEMVKRFEAEQNDPEAMERIRKLLAEFNATFDDGSEAEAVE